LFRNQTVSPGIGKNGGTLFRRPKLILSCSAEGKEGRISSDDTTTFFLTSYADASCFMEAAET
jgi:hypothetical protein